MALQRKKFSEIPADAIVLTEDEALRYQSKILNNWKNTADIFGYKFGAFILGGSSLISGFYINTYFRRKFKLGNYGKVSTYLPVCLLPAAFSALTHMEFVLKDVVLQKRNTCPVCLEMRASALQALVGCAFPFILSPLANLSMAHRYATITVPDILKPKQVLQFVRKQSSPIANIAFILFISHAVIGSTVTYLESKSVRNVNEKLYSLEKELENS